MVIHHLKWAIIFAVFICISPMSVMALEIKVGILESDKAKQEQYLSLLNKAYPNRTISIEPKQSPAVLLESLAKYEIDIIIPWYPRANINVLESNYTLAAQPEVVLSHRQNINLNITSNLAKYRFAVVDGLNVESIRGVEKNAITVDSYEEGLQQLTLNKVDGVIHYQTNKNLDGIATLLLIPERQLVAAFAKTIVGRKLKKQFDHFLNHDQKDSNNSEIKPIDIYFAGRKSDYGVVDGYELSPYQTMLFSGMKDYQVNIKWLDNFTTYLDGPAAQNSCGMMFIKNQEREAKYNFSRPVNFSTGIRLYSLMPLNVPEPVALSTLVKIHPSLQLGYGASRSYGDLDSDIESLPFFNKISYNTSNDVILKHFINNKFQLFLTLPDHAMQAKLPIKVHGYELQNSAQFIDGHIMCGRSDFNSEFLDKLDKSLLNLAKYKQFFDAQLTYLPESEHKHFAKYFKQIYP